MFDSFMEDALEDTDPCPHAAMQSMVRESLSGCLWSTKEILLKLAEETGELVRAVRKEPDNVEAEIGDVLFAILAFCIEQKVDGRECLRGAIGNHLKKLSKTWEGEYENGVRVDTPQYNEFERRLAKAEDDGVNYENETHWNSLEERDAPVEPREDARAVEALSIPWGGFKPPTVFERGHWGMSLVFAGWQVQCES